MTPESKVKRRVTALLREYAPEVWFFMPVPTGYGVSTVDYIGVSKRRFFGIETKAPGAKPTPRQEAVLEAIRAAGGVAFVIDDDASMLVLEFWLNH